MQAKKIRLTNSEVDFFALLLLEDVSEFGKEPLFLRF